VEQRNDILPKLVCKEKVVQKIAAKEKKNLSVISVTYAKVLFEIDMSLFSYLA
jgi:hypothetical protein